MHLLHTRTSAQIETAFPCVVIIRTEMQIRVQPPFLFNINKGGAQRQRIKTIASTIVVRATPLRPGNSKESQPNRGIVNERREGEP